MSKGIIPPPSAITPYLSEYSARARLKEIGYSTDIKDLDDYKGKMFIAISSELDSARDAERKRQQRRSKTKR